MSKSIYAVSLPGTDDIPSHYVAENETEARQAWLVEWYSGELAEYGELADPAWISNYAGSEDEIETRLVDLAELAREAACVGDDAQSRDALAADQGDMRAMQRVCRALNR